MIDQRSANCSIKSYLDGSFFREENDGHFLLIPSYGSYNDALLTNEQGRKIIELLMENVRTPADLISSMQQAYSQIELNKISEDVYSFLNLLRMKNLIDMKGTRAMYEGETIAHLGAYSVYRCLEGDLKVLNRLIAKKNPYVSFKYTDTYQSIYSPVYVRGRVFAYIEDFYLLKNNQGDAVCMLSILHGRGVFNGIPLIGIFLQIEDIPADLMTGFVASCLENFKAHVEPDVGKLRIKMPIDKGRLKQLSETFEKVGFEQVAYLEHELGLNEDAIMMDYLF